MDGIKTPIMILRSKTERWLWWSKSTSWLLENDIIEAYFWQTFDGFNSSTLSDHIGCGRGINRKNPGKFEERICPHHWNAAEDPNLA